MKTKCITHPPRQTLVIIREDYLAICDGNHCAAAIMNIFEYWNDHKEANREQAAIENKIAAEGGAPVVSDELWIYKSIPDLKAELLGLFGESKISEALDLIKKKGFLDSRNNPKYGWDRTLQYQLNVSVTQAVILRHGTSRKNKASKVSKVRLRSLENKAAIPKTTQKTTKKNNSSATPTPVKRDVIRLPDNVWTWQQLHVEEYYKDHTSDLDALAVAFDAMYVHFVEMPLVDERGGIETYKELNRQGVMPDEYKLIIAHTRKARAWQDRIRIGDVMKEISSYKAKFKRNKIINDDPAMDLSKPVDIVPILMRKSEEAS